MPAGHVYRVLIRAHTHARFCMRTHGLPGGTGVIKTPSISIAGICSAVGSSGPKQIGPTSRVGNSSQFRCDGHSSPAAKSSSSQVPLTYSQRSLQGTTRLFGKAGLQKGAYTAQRKCTIALEQPVSIKGTKLFSSAFAAAWVPWFLRLGKLAFG